MYSAGGSYTVNLTATNAGGSDTITRADYISVQSDPVIRIASGNISAPGGEITLALTLSSAPKGLSGHNLNLSISNPAVAEITGVTFPAWASALNATGTLPASQDLIAAADVNGMVGTGAADVTLATVTVRGLSAGETVLVISRTNFDDDDGSEIQYTVVNGMIVVG